MAGFTIDVSIEHRGPLIYVAMVLNTLKLDQLGELGKTQTFVIRAFTVHVPVV